MIGFGDTTAQDRVVGELYYSPKLHQEQPGSTFVFGFPGAGSRAHLVNLVVTDTDPSGVDVLANYGDAFPRGLLTTKGDLLVTLDDAWGDSIRVPPIGPRIQTTNLKDGPIARANDPTEAPKLPGGGRLRLATVYGAPVL